jgi:GT2 family glycosyltransferase
MLESRQSQAEDIQNIQSTKLAIIILNWNAAADTIRCLRHIASWERLQPTIWVVDNGSTDGGVEAISRECPEVHLIRNSANLGFAGGNNLGIVEALSTGDAPILLLNNDAFVENPARHHQSHVLELPIGEPLQIVECVPGTVVVVRAEVFRTVGLLDEDYFFASEVADLCMQARRHGYLSAVDTRARAFHTLSRSSDLRGTLHTYYIIRNRFLLIRKFHRNWKALFYVFWTLYSLALSVKVQLNGNAASAQAMRLGLADGLRGRFGGQNERVLAATGQTSHV